MSKPAAARRERATALARELGNSASDSAAELNALVYDELARIARQLMRAERRDHTLTPTALVHEAYLRLVDDTELAPRDRLHFLRLAARNMRRVLIDHARRRNADKRSAAGERVTLTGLAESAQLSGLDVLALEEALNRLAALDERKSLIIELRFFAGMPVTEIAQLLGTSPSTISEDWIMARTWLHSQLR